MLYYEYYFYYRCHSRQQRYWQESAASVAFTGDMKHFKELTTGHAIIMGRKTFESLPNGPLPDRKNVVLTSLPEAGFVNCFACESMRDALDLCEKEDEIFIIGGALVYRQALSKADKMYITRVHHELKMQMLSSR